MPARLCACVLSLLSAVAAQPACMDLFLYSKPFRATSGFLSNTTAVIDGKINMHEPSELSVYHPDGKVGNWTIMTGAPSCYSKPGNLFGSSYGDIRAKVTIGGVAHSLNGYGDMEFQWLPQGVRTVKGFFDFGADAGSLVYNASAPL